MHFSPDWERRGRALPTVLAMLILGLPLATAGTSRCPPN